MDEFVDTPPTDPAAAFTALAAEIAEMRASVDGLVALVEAKAGVDYTPSMGAIAKSLEVIQEHPALRITPEQHRQAMAQAGSGLMLEASESMARAVQGVERERVALAGYYRAALTQDQQFQWMCWVGSIALVLGLILSPMISSILPFGLNARMAAFMMHDTRWSAGAALMQADNPGAWQEMVAADALIRANQSALTACRRQVLKTGKAQRCGVNVSPATS